MPWLSAAQGGRTFCFLPSPGSPLPLPPPLLSALEPLHSCVGGGARGGGDSFRPGGAAGLCPEGRRGRRPGSAGVCGSVPYDALSRHPLPFLRLRLGRPFLSGSPPRPRPRPRPRPDPPAPPRPAGPRRTLSMTGLPPPPPPTGHPRPRSCWLRRPFRP